MTTTHLTLVLEIIPEDPSAGNLDHIQEILMKAGDVVLGTLPDFERKFKIDKTTHYL